MSDFARGTWVITGAGSGFGREFARRLDQRGARLALWDRDRQGLAKTSELLRGKHQSFVVDVSDRAAVHATAEATGTTVGPVAHVINSAGVLRVGRALGIGDENEQNDIDALVGPTKRRLMMDINFHGSVDVTEALMPQIKASSGRSIVLFVSSMAGLRGFAGLAGYSASKFALVGFAQALREEMREMDVDVRALCPPPGDTPMVQAIEKRPAIYKLAPLLSAETVVDATLRAIDKPGDLKILVDDRTKTMDRVDRLAPGVIDRIVRLARYGRSK